MRPLATLGNVNVDLIMGPTTPWPTPGTEVLVAHDELRPGGAAGNTALAWAGLGVPFTIASNVGDDAFGVWLINAFRPYSEAWTTSPCRTTVSVGLTHPGDERTFFTRSVASRLPERLRRRLEAPVMMPALSCSRRSFNALTRFTIGSRTVVAA